VEIEIGRGKRGREAYAFDDIAIVPSRRTRDPQEVSIAWQIDAYRFELPLLAAPMDSVVSPATAIALGRLGGVGVLNLEGLWTRYADPEPLLAEIGELAEDRATPRMQEIYAAPIQPELIAQRIHEVRAAGVTVAASLSPGRTAQYVKTVVDAGVDLFVIRGTTVSAEHVSGQAEPLNLKQFIYELDVPVVVGGVATYTAALHLMRTGAAGVLVGFGGGAAHTTRAVLGVAVLGAVLQITLATSLSADLANVPGLDAATVQRIVAADKATATGLVGGVKSLEESLVGVGLTSAQSAALKPRIAEIASTSLETAMGIALRTGSAVVFFGAIIAVFVVRRRDYEHGQGGPSGG